MKGALRRWSTPTAHDGSSTGNKPRPRQGGESLRTQVERRLWPTATATDSQGSGSKGYGPVAESTGKKRSEGTTLTDAMADHHGHLPREIRKAGIDGLVLCPEFVEALMGLPEGWTHVDDESASAALGMGSSRPKRKRPSKNSGDGS